MQSFKKKNHSNFISILSLMIFLGMNIYVFKSVHSFSEISNIEFKYIIALFCTNLLQFIFIGLIFKFLAEEKNLNLSIKEWFGLTITTEMFNLFLSKNNISLKKIYFTERKNTSIISTINKSHNPKIWMLSILGITGYLYFHYLIPTQYLIYSLIEYILIALTILSLFCIFFSESIFYSKISIKKILSKVIFLNILTFLFFPIKTYISFKAIGVDLQISQSLEIGLALAISSIFYLIPGNFGITELVTTCIAQQYGINFETALIASLIDRAILFLLLMPLGVGFYISLFLELKIPNFKLRNLEKIEDNL